jgi:hypothetical protein
MTDNTASRTFPANEGGVKLVAILEHYHEGSHARRAWKMHALDLISWIVENAIRGCVELVQVW